MRFKAELVVGGLCYDGLIESFSEDKIYLLTPINCLDNGIGDTPLDLKFHPIPGETLNVPCKIKWSYKTPPYGLTNSLVVEIVNHIPGYKDFYKTLH